jgi:hypothetical protein
VPCGLASKSLPSNLHPLVCLEFAGASLLSAAPLARVSVRCHPALGATTLVLVSLFAELACRESRTLFAVEEFYFIFCSFLSDRYLPTHFEWPRFAAIRCSSISAVHFHPVALSSFSRSWFPFSLEGRGIAFSGLVFAVLCCVSCACVL